MNEENKSPSKQIINSHPLEREDEDLAQNACVLNQNKGKKRKKKKYSYSMQKSKSVVYSDDASSAEAMPFPAAAYLLASAKDEYNKERERSQFLDNKASFFMSAIILVATVFIPIIPFDKFISFIQNNCSCRLCLFILACIALVAAFTMLLISFKKLYNAYSIQGFSRFNIENVDEEAILKRGINSIEVALCENYKNIVLENISTNDKKADNIKNGIKLSAIGFLLIALSAMALVILVGV